jgi:hypothetical protein
MRLRRALRSLSSLQYLGGPPVTNIRNTSSPHWRGWLKPEHRCLVPAGLDDHTCFAIGLVELAEAGVGVGLHQSGIARQMLLCLLNRPCANKKTVPRRSLCHPMWRRSTGAQPPHAGRPHRSPRRSNSFFQWRQVVARVRRHCSTCTGAVDVALTIERQVQAIFGEQDMAASPSAWSHHRGENRKLLHLPTSQLR